MWGQTIFFFCCYWNFCNIFQIFGGPVPCLQLSICKYNKDLATALTLWDFWGCLPQNLPLPAKGTMPSKEASCLLIWFVATFYVSLFFFLPPFFFGRGVNERVYGRKQPGDELNLTVHYLCAQCARVWCIHHHFCPHLVQVGRLLFFFSLFFLFIFFVYLMKY